MKKRKIILPEEILQRRIEQMYALLLACEDVPVLWKFTDAQCQMLCSMFDVPTEEMSRIILYDAGIEPTTHEPYCIGAEATYPFTLIERHYNDL